jgi:hypothetical protein
MTDESHTDTTVLVAAANRHRVDTLGQERKSVRFDYGSAHVTEYLCDRSGRRVTGAQEIHILRRPGNVAFPEVKEHGAFEHEAAPLRHMTQTAQQALDFTRRCLPRRLLPGKAA